MRLPELQEDPVLQLQPESSDVGKPAQEFHLIKSSSLAPSKPNHLDGGLVLFDPYFNIA